MSAILLDGSIVHYEVLGRGRPVIFLHGWLGSWRLWISPMQVISIQFRSYALDLWGFGDSAHQKEGYSIEHHAQMLRQFMDQLGIGKIALIGHSLGGLVAFRFAARWPESVDRLMAISTPLEATAISPRWLNASLPDLVNWLTTRSPEIREALSDALRADPQALAASLQTTSFPRLFNEMLQRRIPCLLVYGEEDPAIFAPSLEQVVSLPSYVHQIVLEEAAHFPMLEQPARFQRLLLDFLALPSGDSPRELQLKEEWHRRVR